MDINHNKSVFLSDVFIFHLLAGSLLNLYAIKMMLSVAHRQRSSITVVSAEHEGAGKGFVPYKVKQSNSNPHDNSRDSHCRSRTKTLKDRLKYDNVGLADTW